ncbi:hypothetical protein [Mycobacterium riyadhense]|uniref:hypothetical protein n=1 Tax=Mycobacterium riyadhense TaxID=486698 RepID=UPI00194E001C|nr:hypothetical protein [Mycobacterium riyadhense]
MLSNETGSCAQASDDAGAPDDVTEEPGKVRRGIPISPLVAWVTGLIFVGTLIRIPQLWHGLNEMHAFRQTQTAYVALEYARRGINLLHTPLPIFGPNADVPMELPLVQAAAALLIRLGVKSDAALRIIGLMGFQAAATLLALLVFRWHGRLVAIVVVALFEVSPFGLAWGAAALIDFPAVAFSIGMVAGLDAWFRAGSRAGLLLGTVSGWLAFLVKATTAPAWCFLLAVSALTAYLATRSWGRIVAGFLAGPVVGNVMALAWVRYGDSVKVRNPLTKFLFSGTMHDWNFGSIHQRLDPHAYAPALLRVSTEIAGPLGLGLVLAVVGIVLAATKIERIHRGGWLATALCAPMVFFNLYNVHNYYLIAVFPAIVAAVGIGIVALAQWVRGNDSVVAAVLTAVVVVGSAAPHDLRQWILPPKPDPVAGRLRVATRPDDLIVGVGCTWNPQTLYFADRRGLMLWEYNVFDAWKQEKIDDYRYIFSCDSAVRVTDYLPAGYDVVPTSTSGLWRISRAQR